MESTTAALFTVRPNARAIMPGYFTDVTVVNGTSNA